MAAIELVPADWKTTLKRVVQTCHSDSLLAKGVHEVCKAIETTNEKLKAKYVILAKNITEPKYEAIVRGLAKNNQIPIIEIEEGETLGEWLGMCRLDKNKNAVKKRKCSSVAIRNFSPDLSEEEKQLFMKQKSS